MEYDLMMRMNRNLNPESTRSGNLFRVSIGSVSEHVEVDFASVANVRTV